MTCPVNLKGAFLVDDVRMEANGKFILVGAYNSNIVVSGFPFARQMHVVLLASFQGAGTCKIELRGLLPSGDVMFSVGGELSTQAHDSSALLPIGEIPFLFSQPTTFSMEARLNDGDWKAIGSWAVVKANPEDASVRNPE